MRETRLGDQRPKHDIDSLVENHQALVYHLAMRVHRRLPVRQDLDDLIGYGMIGLLEAAKKFQPNRGIEFTTFAYPRINGSIYDGVSKLSWMSRSRYKRLLREKQKEENENGEPTGSSETIPEEILNVSSLDPEAAQAIPADDEETSASHAVQQEQEKILGQLIGELPNRENRLITMIYIEGLTLQEAAERLGISKGWASKMHRKTLTQLAVSMKDRNR